MASSGLFLCVSVCAKHEYMTGRPSRSNPTCRYKGIEALDYDQFHLLVFANTQTCLLLNATKCSATEF